MQFNIIIEKDEDGWINATVPSLPDCHNQAQSLDELQVRIRRSNSVVSRYKWHTTR